MSVVRLYTDLEMNVAAPDQDYDLLRESGLLKLIMEKIGEDMDEFTTVYDMVWEDMMCNENDLRVFVAGQIMKFAEAFGQTVASEELKNNLGQLGELVKKYSERK